MGKPKLNLVGKKFNRLTVLSFVDTCDNHTRWLCQCKCGRQCVTQGSSLISGNSKSCGCLQQETAGETPDLIGQRFGRLLVIARAKSKHNRSRWKCICDCGKECEAVGKTLKKGKKRSCGCLRRTISFMASDDYKKRDNIRIVFGQYRSNAERDGKEFELTEDQFCEIVKLSCFYCGRVPNTFNGIDRKDSSIGYVLDNCVSCCKSCNYMKGRKTVEEFISACESIVNHKKSAEMFDSKNTILE